MTVSVHWGDATVLPRAQTVAGYLHFSRRVQPFPDSKFSGEMLPTKAYYGHMASIPCPTFFELPLAFRLTRTLSKHWRSCSRSSQFSGRPERHQLWHPPRKRGCFHWSLFLAFWETALPMMENCSVPTTQAMSNKMQVQISQLERQILEEKSKCDELKQKLDRSDSG